MGGAGSGKSYTAVQKVLLRCLNEVGHRFLVVRKTMPAIKRSVWALFIELIDRYGIAYKKNKSELQITIGSNEVWFVSLDDVEKLKSIQGITGVFIEEATEVSESDFDQIDLRLRGYTQNYKQIILAYNPITERHWLKRRFWDKINADNYNLHTTYKNNAFIDPDYKTRLLRLEEENPSLYKVYGLGEWGRVEGLIYSNWQPISNIKVSGDVYYGLDFGFKNPTALIKVIERDSEYYISEVVYQSHLTMTNLIDIMKTECTDLPIYCDSAEPYRIEELSQAGFNVHKAIKSVSAGIAHLQSCKLWIDDNSENIKKELLSYSFQKDRNGNTLDTPVKLYDHALDAMRYAIYTHNLKNRGEDMIDWIGAYEVK